MPKSSERKSKKSNGWMDTINEVQDDMGGDLPWFVSCKKETWHQFDVEPSTATVEKDGGKDGEWSCIRVLCNVPKGDDDEGDEWGGEWREEEIPFWAMKAFVAILKEECDPDDTIVNLAYKRTQNGTKNVAHFKVV